MPRKVNYIKENMHLHPFRVLLGLLKNADLRQPVVVVARQKGTSDLYVASTDNGQIANSLLAKAMNFIKVN